MTRFAEFAQTFMATYARSNNKPSEYEAKRSILTHHLLPAFGSRPLDQITGKDVEELKAKLLNTKRSAKRINNVLNVLSKIFRYAVEIELLDRMPRIKTLKVPPQKFDFFTFEELEALVARSAQEPEWHAAVLVAGEAGLRLGEMLALEWTGCGTIGAARSARRRAGGIGRSHLAMRAAGDRHQGAGRPRIDRSHESVHAPGARRSCPERNRAARTWAIGGRQSPGTILSS